MKSMDTWHMFVVMSILVVTVWTLAAGKVAIGEREVTRNGKYIPWDQDLANNASIKFKRLSITVKLELTKDLEQQGIQGILDLDVAKFTQKHGNTWCEFKCEINSTVVAHKDIEKNLNKTIDIGSYYWIKMCLQPLSVPWIRGYNDPNSLEHKNLTFRIKDALSEVYKDPDYILNFEITLLSRAFGGSVAVEYLVFVNQSESELKQADLQQTFDEFTKDNSLGGMALWKRGDENKCKDVRKPDGYVVVLVVIGASVMGIVIIAFFVRVLHQTCSPKVNPAPEERLESHRRKSRTISVTALENDIEPTFLAINRSVKDALLEGSNVGLVGFGSVLKIEAGCPEI